MNFFKPEMTNLNRTFSSPNLRASTHYGKKQRETQGNKFGYKFDDNEDEEFYVIGDRVFVDGYKVGSVAYFGEVEFASGDWVGVVLDNPLGNHNGKLHGREYFQCAPFHGLFVRPHRVSRIADSALGHSVASSRSTTPLPTLQRDRSLAGADGRTYSRSPASSSVTDSYMYDDDYRQTKVPSISSLDQRIKLMDELDERAARLTPESRPTSALSMTPIGILKKSQSPRSSSESRYDLKRSNDPRVPVFNFRPRRTRLDEHSETRGSSEFGTTRAYSPILSDISNRSTVTPMIDLSSEPVKIGDPVLVHSERGDMSGTLRFMGQTNFATGEWAGVELNVPDGKNDGSVLGYRYFSCPNQYGLFVPATRVKKYDPRGGFKTMRATITSPPPPKSTNSYNSDSFSSRSVTPASYYSSDKTPSPSQDRRYDYISSSNRTTPSGRYNHGGSLSSVSRRPADARGNHYENNQSGSFRSDERLKFDDADIEYQLRKSLNSPSLSTTNGTSRFYDVKSIKPKSIKYTFSSSKYDGNPIARRTVEYI